MTLERGAEGIACPGAEGVPGPRDFPEGEVPLIGVGRVEFHRGLARLERSGKKQAANVTNSIGWTLVFIGAYIAIGGWAMTTRKARR